MNAEPQNMSTETLALTGAWEVVGGIIPGQPLDDYTKRWAYTSDLRIADQGGYTEEAPEKFRALVLDGKVNHFSRLLLEATAYYFSLNDPRTLNWARLDWVWY